MGEVRRARQQPRPDRPATQQRMGGGDDERAGEQLGPGEENLVDDERRQGGEEHDEHGVASAEQPAGEAVQKEQRKRGEAFHGEPVGREALRIEGLPGLEVGR